MHERAWLVSYPRSGSTWLRMIIANLLFPEKNCGYKDTDYICPDFHALARWNAEQVWNHTRKLFFVKSHHVFLDEYSEERCVYLYRDPRDVVISEYLFEQWKTGADFPFEEFLNAFLRGETKFESWKLHVACWTTNTENADLKHVLKYEDLFNFTENEVSRICNFLQLPATNEQVRTAIKKCSFKNCVEISKEEGVARRKRGLFGKPGGWKQILSNKQNDRVWRWAGDLMEKLGYKYDED